MATTKQNTGAPLRLLPHNLEAEQGVLGCVLIDSDAGISVFGSLVEDDFYSPVHKIVFGAMKSLVEKNSPVDLVTLSAALSADGKIDQVGGIDYLTALSDTVPSSANLRHYLELVKKFSVKRKLVSASGKIAQIAAEGDDERADLAAAEKLIFDISREGERKDLTAIGGEIPAVIERLDTIQRDPTAIRGLKTGFYGLDSITNGLQKSDLVILAARPSVGKTSLALNIVLNTALKRKAKCAIFSLEMSKQSLATRALCSVACVSLSRAMKGELSAEEWKRIWVASKQLSDAGIYIDDNSVITPAEITSKCMRLKREHGLDFVMIDYLGLMGSGLSKRESRQVEVADNSRYMKILAKELEIPVLLLSQLNRSIEKRTGAESRPVLSDLRESGAIEQDADIVMFIHKDRTEGSEADEVELIVAKHRNGPLGTVKLKWVGEFTTFMNMSAEQSAQDAREKVEKKNSTDKPKKSVPEELPPIVPLDQSGATDVF